MPQFKQIWTYSTQGAQWSEVYYQNDTSLAESAKFSTAFLNKRLKFLNTATQLVKIRTSDILNPRASVVTPIRKDGQGYGGNEEPENINTAAVCTLSSSAAPSSRRLWLRGLVNQDLRRSAGTGTTFITPRLQEAITAWIKELAAQSYCVNTILRVGQDNVKYFRIASVTPVANSGQAVLDIGGDWVYVVGSLGTISLASKKDLPGLNGTFTIVKKTATTVTIDYQTPGNATITSSSARIKAKVPVTGAVINPALSGFSFAGSRKTKNALTGSRGAKSASRIRSLV